MINKKKIIEFFSRIILPVTLSSVIANSVISCYYYEQRWLYSIVFFMVSIGLFFVFDKLKKRKFLAPFAYIFMLVIVLFVTINCVKAGYDASNVPFINWFYLDRNNVEFVYYYFISVYIGGGFFLTSIFFYFTQVRYRSIGSMLCMLFPFAIYAKRAEIMSNFQVSLIITLFLAIMIQYRHINKKQNIKTIYDLPYIISVALFVTFVSSIAMLIPKPQFKSVLETNSHAFDLYLGNNTINDYSRYNDTTEPTYGNDFTEEILFYCESDYPMQAYYLKRQNYTSFKNGKWYSSRSNKNSYDNSKAFYLNRNDSYSKFKDLADTGNYAEYGLTSDKFNLPEFKSYTMRIFDDDFRGIYVPAPLGTISENSISKGYYMYGDGEASVLNNRKSYDYTLNYYPETEDYRKFAKSLGITFEDYYNLLSDAVINGDITDNSLIYQYNDANSNYRNNVEYSQKMNDLALEITKDKVSDYDKAQALCDYFTNNGYTYDIDYIPDDTSIDYFVFESKTGTCSSYATAMTIMARLNGLAARYVEGFIAYEPSDNGTICVRDSHAHAFVEVFIPGAGWISFEPTVPGFMVERHKASGSVFAETFKEYFKDYLGKTALFLIVVFAIIAIVMLERIKELFFRIKIHFTKNDKRIIILYARIVRLLEFSSGKSLSSYTVKMITDFAEKENYTDIKSIAYLFEKTCFGCIPLSDDDFIKAYSDYKKCYRFLKKKPKHIPSINNY